MLHFKLFVESTKEGNAIVVDDFSKPPHHTHCLHPHPLEEKKSKSLINDFYPTNITFPVDIWIIMGQVHRKYLRRVRILTYILLLVNNLLFLVLHTKFLYYTYNKRYPVLVSHAAFTLWPYFDLYILNLNPF